MVLPDLPPLSLDRAPITAALGVLELLVISAMLGLVPAKLAVRVPVILAMLAPPIIAVVLVMAPRPAAAVASVPVVVAIAIIAAIDAVVLIPATIDVVRAAH